VGTASTLTGAPTSATSRRSVEVEQPGTKTAVGARVTVGPAARDGLGEQPAAVQELVRAGVDDERHALAVGSLPDGGHDRGVLASGRSRSSRLAPDGPDGDRPGHGLATSSGVSP
jgi:hypothetical protein